MRPTLEGDSDFQVVGEASSGKETLEICLQLQPDLLIMDVFMPDGEGTQVAAVLQSRAPEIKIVLISANAGAVYERLAQSQGAVGFIPKILRVRLGVHRQNNVDVRATGHMAVLVRPDFIPSR